MALQTTVADIRCGSNHELVGAQIGI